MGVIMYCMHEFSPRIKKIEVIFTPLSDGHNIVSLAVLECQARAAHP